MKKLRIIALALAVLCLLAPLTQAVSAAEFSPSSENEASLDFSSFDETSILARVSPSDLLSLLLERVYRDERVLSDAEKNYLDLYFGEYLIYDGMLSPSLVSIETSGQTITVMAKSYSYEAKNGRVVTYSPVRVTMGSTAKPLSYSLGKQCFVAEIDASEELPSLTVHYVGSIALPKETVNRLLTLAFDDASAAQWYEDQKTNYAAALAEYQNYLRALEQYDADCVTYNEYLAKVSLYEKAREAYQKNQDEWEAYRQKQALYEAYRNELDLYDQNLKKYNENYQKYLAQIDARDAYLINLNKIRSALVPMESLFLKPSNGKTGTLYQALQNNELVTMFEKYQNVLPKQPINGMRDEAERLNTLLGEYEEARKISEQKAFESYQKNYDEICRLFQSLYDRMSAIFAPPKGSDQSAMYTLMCAKLEAEYGIGTEESEYKKWRIQNVLAHLYLICRCLDDAKTSEATWNFYSNTGKACAYYFSDLLSQNLIISDTNTANPSNLRWMNEVSVSDPPQMPEKPIEVIPPLAPPTMEEPTPPPALERPIPPELMDVPIPPPEGDPSLMLRTKDLRSALQNKELYDRTEFTEEQDPILTLPEISIEKRVRGVSIYGARGCLLEENGSSELPVPSEDSETLPYSFVDGADTYTLEGWSTSEDGSAISAIYRRTTKTKVYLATFVVDGITVYETLVPAMHTAQFNGSVTKEHSDSTEYFFETWDPPLAPMSGDTKYHAVFREQPRKYSVSFSILDNPPITKEYAWGEIPTPPTVPLKDQYDISGSSLFEFCGWGTEQETLPPVTQNATYTAQYQLLATLDADETILFEQSTSQGYLLIASGNKISSISNLVEKTVSENCRLDILFSERNVTLSLDLMALQALHREGVAELLLDQNETYGTAIRFFRPDGTEIFLSEGELRLSLPHGFDADANVYLSSYDPSLSLSQATVPCTPTETEIKLIATAGIYYRPYERFTLSVSVGENGQAMTDESIYSEGDRVYFTVHPSAHYRISKIFFQNPITGETIPIKQKYAEMPAYNAVLCVEFAPIEYTIKFVYHGETKIEKLPFGAPLVFPEVPPTFEEDGLFYTFIGWSETASVVTGDATYTAGYYSVRIEDLVEDEGSAWSAVIWNILVPLAILALLILGILITVPIVIVKQVKKKKTKKKQKNNQNE